MTTQDNNEAASAPNVGSDYAEVLARQLAQWTKERDRLQTMIDTASASQSSTPVPRVGGPDEQYWEEQPDGTITPVDPVDMAGGASRSCAAINDSEDARAYLVGWMRDNFLSDKTFAPYIFKELAGDFAYQLARALAHVARQRQESAPTDVSMRLRERATGGYTAVRTEDGALMLAAAAEIERYHYGMLAWKRTAEAKDAEFAASRATPSAAVAEGVTPEKIFAVALEHGYGVYNGASQRPFNEIDFHGKKMLAFIRALSAAPPAKKGSQS